MKKIKRALISVSNKKDLKPLDLWFQKFDEVKNFSLDMQEYENCLKMTKTLIM